MIKYYTRACNFYYGSLSKEKIKKKQSLPLSGNNIISFDTIEIINRKHKKKYYIALYTVSGIICKRKIENKRRKDI